MTPMWPVQHRRRGLLGIVAGAILSGLLTAPPVFADDLIVGGMTWMTQYPATWNAGAPKVVSDGLFSYAALCGYDSSQYTCSVARRRTDGAWVRGGYTFSSHQPAVMVIDRKGRLNVFSNFPTLTHVRIDHPSVDLNSAINVPVSFPGNVGYMHASYDAPSDSILLAFNETTAWTTHLAVKAGDAAWLQPAILPGPDTASMYLYSRTLRANGKYYVLAGEHPRSGGNASYKGAVLWQSDSPAGPWTTRILHRSVGQNVGVFYQNMSFPVDLQADDAGNVRALIHLDESGSGHTPLAEGLHISREEDGYALRHVGGDIDDGFPLYVDPSGVHLAFAFLRSGAPHPDAGKMVVFRSADGGATWGPATRFVSVDAINPVTVEKRNGSMLGGNDLSFIYSTSVLPPFTSVQSALLPLGVSDSADRYDYNYTESNGTVDYVRAYSDPASGRSYYYIWDANTDGSYTISYSYTAGDYYQVYIGKSNGSYRFYNSEGYSLEHVVAVVETYGYWFADDDGTQDYIQVYRDPAQSVLWWIIYDFAPGGGWTYTYVYYRGTYWYIDVTSSNGTYTRSDSTGYYSTS
jgi:hypothetical protein